jgi:thioredoxin reductase (NADPH)
VTLTNRSSGQSVTHPIANLFVMIGPVPNRHWLDGCCLALDDKGFVLTGFDQEGRRLSSPFATSKRGIFAAGDVRSGSVKRVASGVGEGSVVVHAIHDFLRPGLA